MGGLAESAGSRQRQDACFMWWQSLSTLPALPCAFTRKSTMRGERSLAETQRRPTSCACGTRPSRTDGPPVWGIRAFRAAEITKAASCAGGTQTRVSGVSRCDATTRGSPAGSAGSRQRQDAASCGGNPRLHSASFALRLHAKVDAAEASVLLLKLNGDRHSVPAAPARQRRTGHPFGESQRAGLLISQGQLLVPAAPRHECLGYPGVMQQQGVARPSRPGRASDKMPLHAVAILEHSANLPCAFTRKSTLRGERSLAETQRGPASCACGPRPSKTDGPPVWGITASRAADSTRATSCACGTQTRVSGATARLYFSIRGKSAARRCMAVL